MKNFLSVKQLNKDEIMGIFALSNDMKRTIDMKNKNLSFLMGKTLCVLTKDNNAYVNGFALGYGYLGGQKLNTSFDNVFEDAKKMQSFGVTTVGLQCEDFEEVQKVSEISNLNVINLGTKYTNPILVLALLKTLSFYTERLNNLNIAILGNKNQSILNEFSYLMEKFGSNVFPFLPGKEEFPSNAGTLTVLHKLDGAVFGADAVIDIGSNSNDNKKLYGNDLGISVELIEKARVDAPLFFNRSVIDEKGQKIDYSFNTVDRLYKEYIAISMAISYMYCK